MKIILILLVSMGFCIDDMSVPNTFVSGTPALASEVNQNFDTNKVHNNRIIDTLDKEFSRFTDFSSGDSTLTRLQVDTIRSNPNVDSITIVNRAFIDTIRSNPDIDSISGGTSFDSLISRADLRLADNIYHLSDTDTKINFHTDTDRIQLAAGGVTFVDVVETAQDLIEINPDESDVDFTVNANSVSDQLFLEGSSGNLALGHNSPAGKFHTATTNVNNVSYFDTYDDGIANSQVRFRKSNIDALGTPIETESGDILGQLLFYGVNTGPGFDLGARMLITQSGASGANVPTKIQIETYSSSAINTDQLKLTSDGNISMSGTLDVDNITASDSVQFTQYAKFNDFVALGGNAAPKIKTFFFTIASMPSAGAADSSVSTGINYAKIIEINGCVLVSVSSATWGPNVSNPTNVEFSLGVTTSGKIKASTHSSNGSAIVGNTLRGLITYIE